MQLLLWLLLFAGLSAAGTPGGATKACLELERDFRSQTFWPGSPMYFEESANTYFSALTVKHPKCVFLPNDADDVADAVRVIGEAKSPFAVLGGGHNTVPGAANIDYGVLISLDRLRTLETVEKNREKGRVIEARLGVGNMWIDVYRFARANGFALNGGRYGQIGVGGLLVGGGIGFFSSMYGFGVDSIMEFEVVLGNGDIVIVDHETRPDLFWALKGGSNYFGIITRVDMETFKQPEGAWFNIKGWAWTHEVQEQYFDKLAEYMAPGGGAEDNKAAIMPVIQGLPALRAYGGGTIQFYAAPERYPAPFKGFEEIEVDKLIEINGIKSWMFLPSAPDFPMWVGFPRRLYWAISFEPTREAMCIANQTILGLADEMLGHIPLLTVGITYQPITKAMLQASVDKGGNAIGLDPEDGPFFALVYTLAWQFKKDDETVLAFARESERQVRAQTEAAGIDRKFTYVNDAGPGQQSLYSYGKESVERLREIQLKYDKEGVMRALLSHPFKLF